jgi:4-hydroxy-4-methyl-2-oxoglutarate aldolase
MTEPLPPRHVVVTQIQRVEAQSCDELRTLGTATAHEAAGRRGFLGPSIRPIQADIAVCGPAVTVLCHPGDNLMIHASVEWCQPGDVLVVATTAPSTHGMFGDLLATALRQRGVAGLVIDAGVRDTVALRSMGFPVWSRYVSCEGTVKASPGSVNVAVVLGSTIVSPGDAVCADDDGVVVIPRREVAATVAAAHQRVASEARTRDRLTSGEPSLDVFGLRALIPNLGLHYVPASDAAQLPGDR